MRNGVGAIFLLLGLAARGGGGGGCEPARSDGRDRTARANPATPDILAAANDGSVTPADDGAFIAGELGIAVVRLR